MGLSHTTSRALSRPASHRLTEVEFGGGIVTPTFSVDDTSPEDGDTITLTVPDNGYDSVEVYDQATSFLFATLSLSSDDWTDSVTIDGAAGDEYDLYAQATDGSATADSEIVTVTVAASYETETNDYETRVTNAGGTLRDKDWANTRITTLKNNTALADCFFLAGPNMGVLVTSGAIETLFDASGSEHDATNATPDERPSDSTLATFGDKYAMDFDGSNDNLDTGLFASEISWPITFVGVWRIADKGDFIFDGRKHGSFTVAAGTAGSGQGNYSLRTESSSIGQGSFETTDAIVMSGLFDTTTSVLRINGVQDDSGALTETAFKRVVIGFSQEANFKYVKGEIASLTILDGDYTSILSTLESEMATHFGITL